MSIKTCRECGVSTLWISWSSLRTHESCKQRGHLSRSGKRATLSDQRIFFPGTVTDRVVRDWLSDEPEKNLGAMPAMVESILEREFQSVVEEGGRVFWKSTSDKDQVLKDCIEAVTKIEPLLIQKVLPYEYDVDFRFRAPMMLPAPWGMEMVILNGAMDIIIRNDQGLYGVEDVKQTRNKDYWRKTIAQLTFYDIAIGAMFNSDTFETGLLQPLCEQTYVPYTVTDILRAQMLQRVTAMANDIWRSDFTPTTDRSQCSMCDTKHACSRFTPIKSKDGKKRLSLV